MMATYLRKCSSMDNPLHHYIRMNITVADRVSLSKAVFCSRDVTAVRDPMSCGKRAKRLGRHLGLDPLNHRTAKARGNVPRPPSRISSRVP
jgi:hypothetical protein